MPRKFKNHFETTGIIFQYFPLMRLVIIIIFLYHVGLFGLVYLFIAWKFYLFIMKIRFNFEPLSKGDYGFLFLKEEEIYNICICLRFEKINKQEFTERFLNAVKFHKRLRSYRIIKFFQFWWKEIEYDKAKNKIVFKEESQVRIDNEHDLNKFMEKEIHSFLDPEQTFPYEIIFLNNIKNKYGSFILLKVDHSFSDGIGILSLIMTLADNFSPVTKISPFLPKFCNICCFLITFIFSSKMSVH